MGAAIDVEWNILHTVICRSPHNVGLKKTTSEVENRPLPSRIDLLNARRANSLRALCFACQDLD